LKRILNFDLFIFFAFCKLNLTSAAGKCRQMNVTI